MAHRTNHLLPPVGGTIHPLVHWEFKFIELDDSLYHRILHHAPTKRTRNVTELVIRGKTGRVYGDLNTLLVMMKAAPGLNKDMQDRRPSLTQRTASLRTITPMLDTMRFCRKTHPRVPQPRALSRHRLPD